MKSSSIWVVLFIVCCGSAFSATKPISFEAFGTTFTLPFQRVRGSELYDLKTGQSYSGAQTMLAGWGTKDSNGDEAVELSFGGAENVGKHEKLPYLSIDAKLTKKFFDTSNNTFYFGGWGWAQKDPKGKTVPVGGFEANILFW